MLIGISDQMGARFDRLRCEVFQNLILSPMNTGLLRAAIATAPTVYGIETRTCLYDLQHKCQLQQHLPFTVLKPVPYCFIYWKIFLLQQLLPFTVLKPTICGPEISIG